MVIKHVDIEPLNIVKIQGLCFSHTTVYSFSHSLRKASSHSFVSLGSPPEESGITPSIFN